MAIDIKTIGSCFKRLHFGLLELSFFATVLALFFQCFPSVWSRICLVLDFRSWSGRNWRLMGLILIATVLWRCRLLIRHNSLQRHVLLSAGVAVLLGSILATIFTVFDVDVANVIAAINPMTWSPVMWAIVFATNLVVVLALRISPYWIANWNARRMELQKKKQQKHETAERKYHHLQREELQRRANRGIDFY